MFNNTLCEWFCEKFEKRKYKYIRGKPNKCNVVLVSAKSTCPTNTKIISIFLHRMIRRDAERFVITLCSVNKA